MTNGMKKVKAYADPKPVFVRIGDDKRTWASMKRDGETPACLFSEKRLCPNRQGLSLFWMQTRCNLAVHVSEAGYLKKRHISLKDEPIQNGLEALQ